MVIWGIQHTPWIALRTSANQLNNNYQTSLSRVLWSWHWNTCTCCSSAWPKLRQDCGKMKASPSAPLIRRSFCHVLGFIYCARNFRPAGARPSTVKPNPCPAWSEHFARKNVEALGSPVVMLEGSPGRSTGMCSDWTQRAPKATSVKCDQMWFLEPSVCSQSTWWFRSLVCWTGLCLLTDCWPYMAASFFFPQFQA